MEKMRTLYSIDAPFDSPQEQQEFKETLQHLRGEKKPTSPKKPRFQPER